MHGSLNVRCDWKTLASHCQSLVFLRLVDEGSASLTLIVEGASEDKSGPQYAFRWNSFYCYRSNTDDFIPWDVEETVNPIEGYGCFHELENSSWIESLRDHRDSIDLLFPEPRHFVILTVECTIEVITNEEPDVSIVEEGSRIKW